MKTKNHQKRGGKAYARIASLSIVFILFYLTYQYYIVLLVNWSLKYEEDWCFYRR